MCYRQSIECWGGEWPVILDGSFTTMCTAHKGGATRKPVIEVSIQDDTSSYKEVAEYIDELMNDELKDVPGVMIYGSGSPFAKECVSLYSMRGKVKVGKGNPTHILVFWDFEDDRVWKRLDGLLAKDTVVRSVVS